MRLRRYLMVLGCVAMLGTAAPVAAAAPNPQWPGSSPLGEASALATPALQAAVLQGVTQIFPAEVIEQSPLRFVRRGNVYVVDHPALYWRVEQAPAAEAVAAELAGLTPGWSTTVFNGPQGRGVYLTYQPSS